MSGHLWRYAVAVVLGAAFDALFYWKFLPYSIRDQHEGVLPFGALPALTLIAGFVLTLGKMDHRQLVPAALLGGFFAAHALLIVADCWNDPTNHNLWPFEFVAIVLLTAPAFGGAAVNALLRSSKRKVTSG